MYHVNYLEISHWQRNEISNKILQNLRNPNDYSSLFVESVDQFK